MRRRQTSNQAILVSENEQPIPKRINFTYSENFNRLVELTTENYPDWRTNILYLLMINNLESYALIRKVKNLGEENIKDDPDDYLTDQFDPSLVYDKETSLLDIKSDVMVKWIIINSLGEETRKIITTQGKTAFETWKTLEKSFTVSHERRRMEIKKKLNSLK
ncbi:hypothetical protein LY90DRAFT_518963 [Neocallimastix californiae]|uniref:Retrotransposon Copia-like N-terminal domain-containing protein n=1 Tax=Neocallimastix californiae TaxID=1754190 RepID=A0A1Y1ZFR8_9FUNG|nr:hypothetical protein LY90DRAFT_518963 [Neocallimastix californiae]|eukprot:ORY08817.1 hypothetical protein LY90DRAFT_518963 [Neocallimastix californiae]